MNDSFSTTPSMNVLCIGSHPDDIEFGCGGTIHKLASRGHRVYMYILTAGDVGGNAETRKKEQEEAARVLNVRDIFWADFQDTKIPFYENVIPSIEKIVNTIAPTFVFVHYQDDTHQDHRHVNQSTIVASRNVPNVLFYEGPTTIDFKPNVFVDIREHLSYKIDSLSLHTSQVMKTNIEQRPILEIAEATAVFRGTQCRIRHAEAFAALRMFVLPGK